MERRGYGEEYINRYKMITRFHHQRVPLVILVCGTACVGKSTIATQLAHRLNLPNVLQTDMVYELLRTSTDAPLVSTPVWARDFGSAEELITEFCRECRIVRKGLAGDLKKAMKDGKPIIIEGIHLDPSIYLMDDENRESTSTPVKTEESANVAVTSVDNGITEKECTETSSINDTESSRYYPEAEKPGGAMSTDQLTEVSDRVESLDLAGTTPENQGETLKDTRTNTSHPVKKEKSSADPIIVPIVLKMAEFDHKALLEEWISIRTYRDKSLSQDQNKLISNLKTIQDYLCSFESQVCL
ncbi:hypothetical protein Syun_005932 [Stephania yunnanensis]|uniref:2-phosphoglycerate kinase n=1 Tax=Stephania yunnanensis TaxID=152371 RepID=A0AAP0KVP3_9MAGN